MKLLIHYNALMQYVCVSSFRTLKPTCSKWTSCCPSSASPRRPNSFASFCPFVKTPTIYYNNKNRMNPFPCQSLSTKRILRKSGNFHSIITIPSSWPIRKIPFSRAIMPTTIPENSISSTNRRIIPPSRTTQKRQLTSIIKTIDA